MTNIRKTIVSLFFFALCASAQYGPPVGSGKPAGSAVFSASGGVLSHVTVGGVVASVTRLGTGNYRIAFTKPQSNFSVSLAATDNNAASVTAYLSGNSFTTIQTSATSFDIYTTYGSAGNVGDPAVVTISVF
jgi:hypothetical protein